MASNGVDGQDAGFSRRTLLKSAALGAGIFAVGGLLEACTSPGSSVSPSTSGSLVPKKGGTLRAGLSGGSSADTLNPLTINTQPDFARYPQLFDALAFLDATGTPKLQLAEEITPNADATSWTIRVRKGVTFHNGKPLTADDVIFTLRTILDPKKPTNGATQLSYIDAAGIKKVDDLTLQVPCSQPFAGLIGSLAAPLVSIIPVGFNAAQPVGTGPFTYKSFTPGKESLFLRNANYWDSGLPYVDEVHIIEFTDETSQLSALQAGQVDLVNLLSASSIGGVRNSGAQVFVSPGGGFTPFTMRVDQPPFTDPRVRQAMRLIADRDQMLNQVFAGQGTIGNDIVSIWDPAYDKSIPQRHQDIDQAKSLLKAAGQENLTVELVTAPIAQGTVQVAQVFAQQAQAAGVTVNLKQVTVSEFFGPEYLSRTFSQDYWGFNPYLTQVQLSLSAKAAVNETHWADPTFNALFEKAQATVDPSAQTELIHQMQKIEHDSGGYIIPYFPPVIDAASTKIHGVVESKTGFPFNSYDFKHLWIE